MKNIFSKIKIDPFKTKKDPKFILFSFCSENMVQFCYLNLNNHFI